MSTQPLIATVPAEQLLQLGLFFGLAAIILLALSIEAGSYPELRQLLRSTRNRLSWKRARRRWYFNTAH